MEIPFQFSLTEEEQLMLNTIEEFKKREKLEERILDWNAQEECPTHLFRKAGLLGFFGHYFPEQYGGLSSSERMISLSTIKLTEDIPDLYSSWAASFGLFGIQIMEMGTEEQRQKYLPGIISGEKIGAFCLTEPGGGSNALHYGSTTLAKEGNQYLLNGSKTFITNGNIADYYYVFCREGQKGDKSGVRSVILSKDFPGIHTTKIKEKFGLRCSDTATVIFEDVAVPEENLVLGRDGLSEEQITNGAFEQLIKERTGTVYMAVGIARGVVRRLTDYLATRFIERKQGKVSPLAFPEVQERLRPMISSVLEKQRIVFSIAQDIDQNQKQYCIEDIIREKIHTVEMAIDTAKNAIQLAGGYGFLHESHLPRLYTNALILSIGAGTIEIQNKILNTFYGFPK